MEKYINRLFEEWKQYGKIIIAVDYDDTISPWKLNSGEDIAKSRIIDILKACSYTGAYIVCFTACKTDRFDEIKAKFEKLGVSLQTINQNPISLPYGNHNKIYANIFLDDRAGLEEALKILETAMYRYRGYLEAESISKLNEIA